MVSAKLREARRWLKLGKGFIKSRNRYLSGELKHTTLEDIVPRLIDENYSLYYPNKVNLIGHSFGGMVALRYALDHPDEIGNVVTIASAYNGTTGIYWQNLMRFAGLYDSRLYGQLLPSGGFVSRLGEKIRNNWSGFESEDVLLTNIIATADEFVKPKDVTLRPIVGYSRSLFETGVPEGHCEAAFNPVTIQNIRFALRNGLPTIALHPIMYDSSFFDDIKNKLVPTQAKRIVAIDYDYVTVQ